MRLVVCGLTQLGSMDIDLLRCSDSALNTLCQHDSREDFWSQPSFQDVDFVIICQESLSQTEGHDLHVAVYGSGLDMSPDRPEDTLLKKLKSLGLEILICTVYVICHNIIWAGIVVVMINFDPFVAMTSKYACMLYVDLVSTWKH